MNLLPNCKYCGGEPVARFVGNRKIYIVYFCSKCGKTPVHYGEERITDAAARKIWCKRTNEV